MSIEKIVAQCREDSIEWFGEEAANNLTTYALGLAGESGEFCDELKKVQRGSQTMGEAFDKLEEELIDVFIYVCNIAALLHINIEDVYNVKRAKNIVRFGSIDTGRHERV